MRSTTLAIAALAAAAGCERGRKAPPADRPAEVGWHTQAVPECGFDIDLPGPAQRSERTFDNGARSVVYRTAGARSDMYAVACIIAPDSGSYVPASVLRAQLDNHRSDQELGRIGVPITGSGVTDAADGGRYWVAFDNGMRVEGAVHVHGARVADLSGSIRPNVPESRAALERVLASYRPR